MVIVIPAPGNGDIFATFSIESTENLKNRMQTIWIILSHQIISLVSIFLMKFVPTFDKKCLFPILKHISLPIFQ